MVEPELYNELGDSMDELMTPREAIAFSEAMKAIGVISFSLPSGFSVVFESSPEVIQVGKDGFVPEYMRVHDEDGFI